ncbi:MAG: DUF3244 domain-containing protein, partial [Chloroflexia bacterium]|nr:DUF3244 domain-containing protein [Chloroflexia bacterium]
MKTTIKLISSIAILLSATLVSATQPNIQILADNSFVLSINEIKSEIKISIKDKYGYKLYKKNVTAEDGKFLQKFSFSNLPDGTYKLEIEDDLKVVLLAINVEDNKIVSKNVTDEKVFKPVVYKKGENVYISKFSPEKEPLKVVIYDNNYDVVYKETLD